MAIVHASPVLLLPCRSNLEEVAPPEARCVVSDSQQRQRHNTILVRYKINAMRCYDATCMLRRNGVRTVLYVPSSFVLSVGKNVPNQALILAGCWLLDLHVRKLPCTVDNFDIPIP